MGEYRDEQTQRHEHAGVRVPCPEERLLKVVGRDPAVPDAQEEGAAEGDTDNGEQGDAENDDEHGMHEDSSLIGRAGTLGSGTIQYWIAVVSDVKDRRVMRISELVARSGVPLATVKYYLREGLLMPGETTSATQARYDEQHVRRLALVRASWPADCR